jgi:hypothetical protein
VEVKFQKSYKPATKAGTCAYQLENQILKKLEKAGSPYSYSSPFSIPQI